MRVTFLSDSPTGITAYAKTVRHLGTRLARDFGHEVVFGGFQYSGAPIEITVDGVKALMYEASTEAALKRAIEDLEADVVVHVRDNWNFTGVSPSPYRLHPYCVKAGSKLVNYSPVDAAPIPDEVLNVPCDLNLTMTRWGLGLLREGGVPADKSDFLYHGVDTKVYRKMDRKDCKEYFGLKAEHPLIGYVAANLDFRKMLPMAMVVFKEVLKQVPDAELCMWTVPLNFWNLDFWRRHLGLMGRVWFPNQTMTWGASEEQMATLYNAFDVDLHVSTAEGFCFPLLEAKACGTKEVATDLPVLRETLGDYPRFIKSYRNFPFPTGLLEWTIDVEDAVTKVVEALRAPEQAPPTIGPDFDWDEIARKLDGILKKVAS